MFKWLNEYNESSSQTKYFVLNWLVYGLALLITTIYCYGRLDYVRSYRTPSVAEREQMKTNNQQKQPLPQTQEKP